MESHGRIKFLPTILEHAAAVIGVTPSRAAQDTSLLAQAHIEAWRRYGHGAVTVGIDVYNAEAEALGCEVRYYEDNNVPGIVKRPGAGMEPAAYASVLEKAASGAMSRGRLQMLLSAAKRVKLSIGNAVPVGLGVSGPFSVCCELMGFEGFVMACCREPEAADALLGIASAFLRRWCGEIAASGLGVTLFESWAALPLLSPGLYGRFAAPLEKAIIDSVILSGGKPPALVIGGDTLPVLHDIISTGTGMVIADYNAGMPAFVAAARQSNLPLRGNIDPKLVASGPVEAILARAEERIRQSGGYPAFALGTGVLPCDTPPEHVLALADLCRNRP